ncbi:uncharacterized protein LOC143278076 [Babylonia areolata]|uniref:uncharacterized protein LOC143278076 n=1 Tax=Babylonia areolata TaxID=304850 RepID=UPI003FD5B758
MESPAHDPSALLTPKIEIDIAVDPSHNCVMDSHSAISEPSVTLEGSVSLPAVPPQRVDQGRSPSASTLSADSEVKASSSHDINRKVTGKDICDSARHSLLGPEKDSRHRVSKPGSADVEPPQFDEDEHSPLTAEDRKHGPLSTENTDVNTREGSPVDIKPDRASLDLGPLSTETADVNAREDSAVDIKPDRALLDRLCASARSTAWPGEADLEPDARAVSAGDGKFSEAEPWTSPAEKEGKSAHGLISAARTSG